MTGARIDLVAPPFSGHLHPVLGIARRLGHEHRVRVLSTERAQAAIAAAGLSGRALLAGRDRDIAAIVNTKRPVRSDPFALYRQLQANVGLLERLQEELGAVWQEDRPDLVIADFAVPGAGSVAMRAGIPWWTSHPSPCVIETADGPPSYLGGWRPLPGPLGAVRDNGGRMLTRVFKRSVHALLAGRLRRLGFPSVYRRDGSEACYSPECVLALGLPELEFAHRWPRALVWVGPIPYTPPVAAPDPPFVPGRKHVLVTCGTHIPWHRELVARAALAAAGERSELEIHLSDGEASSSHRSALGNFHRLAYVRYDTHLPRYDLVVHHGGPGVFYACIHSGRPALVWPADFDQFDFAARLETAGLAWRVRDPASLGGMIRRALGAPELAAAARHYRALMVEHDAGEQIARMVRERIGGRPPIPDRDASLANAGRTP